MFIKKFNVMLGIRLLHLLRENCRDYNERG